MWSGDEAKKFAVFICLNASQSSSLTLGDRAGSQSDANHYNPVLNE
jgi:hypothetical protein